MYISDYVFCIAVVNPQGVNLLGTAFMVANNKVVTARHVISGVSGNIVIIPPTDNNISEYQDTSNKRVNFYPVKLIEEDPINDLCILESVDVFTYNPIKISSFDEVNVGEQLGIIGYPHCNEGRLVQTLHHGLLGAKVLLESSGLKSKHGIINQQTRPGQSGSPVFSLKNNDVVGILIGAYSGATNVTIRLNNINPSDLHQTTHCLSAEYIKEML